MTPVPSGPSVVLEIDSLRGGTRFRQARCRHVADRIFDYGCRVALARPFSEPSPGEQD